MIGSRFRAFGSLGVILVLLTGCAESQFLIHTAKRVGRSVEGPADEGTYKVGKPYQIQGTWYYPAEDYEYDETGIASWYGAAFHGRATANGENYDMNALTAAHRTLPLPSLVRVTNLENGRSLVLRVNDRGPFAKGRIIDISRRGAQLLGFQEQGTARVRVQILADRSRAVAARMTNRDDLAHVGSPITAEMTPKPAVSAEILDAPVGSGSSPEVVPAGSAQQVSVRSAEITSGTIPGTTVPSESAALTVDPDATMRQEPVRPTSIFVQAGAFGVFENANKVRAHLSSLGNVFLDQVLINGRDLYRVRVGPIASVEKADTLLSQIVGTGYPDARIIVD